jgi:hypothetical protein
VPPTEAENREGKKSKVRQSKKREGRREGRREGLGTLLTLFSTPTPTGLTLLWFGVGFSF